MNRHIHKSKSLLFFIVPNGFTPKQKVHVLRPFLSSFIYLRAHNQHVDYSGAYNWGSSPLYRSGETEKKERGVGRGSTEIVQFDTLTDTKASWVGASTTSMGCEFRSLVVLGRKEEPLYWVLVVSRVSCLSWVGASTTSMGNELQSLMDFGRKNKPLYWVQVDSRVLFVMDGGLHHFHG